MTAAKSTARQDGLPTAKSDELPVASLTISMQSIETSLGGGTAPSAGNGGQAASMPQKFGRYRIERELGKGAMGVVYLAEDTQLTRKVALKIRSKTLLDDPDSLTRFYREARTSATLRHPNICPVYDVGSIDGTHYIAMAYIPGQPLSSLLDERKPLRPRQAASLIRKIALALQEAHRLNIIHRDLKPSNVMLDDRKEPIVMDFGLARHINTEESAGLTHSGALLGTPAYMSPEQAGGEHDLVGPQSDVYSLGVMLFQFLTGELPYTGPWMMVVAQIVAGPPVRPSELRSDVDPTLEAVCRKMMERDLSQRYAGMQDVVAALTGFLRKTQDAGSSLNLSVAAASSATAAPISKPAVDVSRPTTMYAAANVEQQAVVSQRLENFRSTQSSPVPRKSQSSTWFLPLSFLLGLLLLSGLYAVVYAPWENAKPMTPHDVPETTSPKPVKPIKPADPPRPSSPENQGDPPKKTNDSDLVVPDKDDEMPTKPDDGDSGKFTVVSPDKSAAEDPGIARLKTLLVENQWDYQDSYSHPSGILVQFAENGTFCEPWRYRYEVTGPDAFRAWFPDQHRSYGEAGVTFTFNAGRTRFTGKYTDDKNRVRKITGDRE